MKLSSLVAGQLSIEYFQYDSLWQTLACVSSELVSCYPQGPQVPMCLWYSLCSCSLMGRSSLEPRHGQCLGGRKPYLLLLLVCFPLLFMKFFFSRYRRWPPHCFQVYLTSSFVHRQKLNDCIWYWFSLLRRREMISSGHMSILVQRRGVESQSLYLIAKGPVLFRGKRKTVIGHRGE